MDVTTRPKTGDFGSSSSNHERCSKSRPTSMPITCHDEQPQHYQPSLDSLNRKLITELISRDQHLESRLVAPDPPLEARLVAPESLPRVKRHQYQILENSFKQCRNPHYIDIMLVAAQCDLSEETVTTWFEHRLALWRKQQGLPANSAHFSNH